MVERAVKAANFLCLHCTAPTLRWFSSAREDATRGWWDAHLALGRFEPRRELVVLEEVVVGADALGLIIRRRRNIQLLCVRCTPQAPNIPQQPVVRASPTCPRGACRWLAFHTVATELYQFSNSLTHGARRTHQRAGRRCRRRRRRRRSDVCASCVSPSFPFSASSSPSSLSSSPSSAAKHGT